MNLAIPFFWCFAFASIALALGVVLSRRILRSALYLTGVLLCGAVFYLLLGAEFLAGIQILVYIGGIVVLLVFTIMLTHSSELEEAPPATLRLLGAAMASLAFLGLGVWMVGASALSETPNALAQPLDGVTAQLGRQLLSAGEGGSVLPFELLSVLLLLAAVGGVYVARKTSEKDSSKETPA